MFLKPIDLSKLVYNEVHELLFADSLPPNTANIIYAHYPALTEAYYYELLLSFLHSKGLLDEFTEYKNEEGHIAKNFDINRFESIYKENLGGLELAYDRLAQQLLLNDQFSTGQKVWYTHDDGSKYEATIQSIADFNGVENFAAIDFRGKLIEKVPFTSLSNRY